MAGIPTASFYNGNKIPVLGLGTWTTTPIDSIKTAVKLGYRHIDTSPTYSNEDNIGIALKDLLDDAVIKRENIFITGKLWNTNHHPDRVESALRQSLDRLKLKYLNLYLMQWPFGFKEGDDPYPTDESGHLIFSDVDYVDTWKAMEKLLETGLVKNIGVCNFNSKQLKRIIDNCKIKPVINQIECHPYLTQLKLSAFCKSNGILVSTVSPFATPDRPHADPMSSGFLQTQEVKQIADKYKKKPNQIFLGYQIQRGHVVVSTTSTKSKLEEHLKIFDFRLTQEEMEVLHKLNQNRRVSPMISCESHQYYPFNEEF